MVLIITILIVLFYFMSPFLRFIVSFNFFRILFQFIVSLKDYIKHKDYNLCKEFGFIDCYCGLFGQGKTKQAVTRVTNIYNRYNGKKIWFPEEQRFITQTIRIYSNVVLCAVPYIPLHSMQQMINVTGSEFGVVNIFLIDEASVVFNSRDYKTNFNSLALNTILTSRHHRIGIILTSQRFNHLDALLRQVVSTVIQCNYNKFLHIQREVSYNAWDLECSKNPLLCKPLSIRYSYSSGYIYSLYDTFAMVQNVKKQCEEKQLISDADTVLMLGNNIYDKSLINTKPRKGSRSRR